MDWKSWKTWKNTIREQKIYSFDYDNTLVTYKIDPKNPDETIYDKPHEENVSLVRELAAKGNKVIIVTSRKQLLETLPWDTSPSPEQFVENLNLPIEEVHYTQGCLKVQKLSWLNGYTLYGGVCVTHLS